MCDGTPQDGCDDHGDARLVQKRLVAGDMPSDAPWLPAQLAAYQTWMDDGFRP